jgi:redox-sensitive bicupin YhaK (pirin superfamily)
MNRKEFLKKGLLGTAILATSGVAAKLIENNISELDNLNILGFNHLPPQDSKIMENKILYKSNSRGTADHGWLKSKHTFSFANYYNPERMHFGVLRVLNDDFVAPGMGFGTHPHDNMEIISIPLEGDLEHKDSMGNRTIIKNGDIQVMSAGTGIQHSEYNNSKNNPVKFLQIWLFPNKRNVQPRYDQLTLRKEERLGQFQQILSPDPNDAGVWIHQDAWFHIAQIEPGKELNYTLKKAGNGIYSFVLNGTIRIDDIELSERDALGVWDTKELNYSAITSSQVLVMEVPMILE